MKHVILVLVCIVLIAEPMLSFADQKRRGRGLGAILGAGIDAAVGQVKTYDANTLDVPALKGCLIKDRDISRSSEAIGTDQANLEQHYTQLEQRQVKIDSLSTYLETNQDREFTSQQEVDQFNANVEEYNRLLDAYNNSVSSYQTKQAYLNSEIDDFNQNINEFDAQCAGKSYYEDDMREAQAAIAAAN